MCTGKGNGGGVVVGTCFGQRLRAGATINSQHASSEAPGKALVTA